MLEIGLLFSIETAVLWITLQGFLALEDFQELIEIAISHGNELLQVKKNIAV